MLQHHNSAPMLDLVGSVRGEDGEAKDTASLPGENKGRWLLYSTCGLREHAQEGRSCVSPREFTLTQMSFASALGSGFTNPNLCRGVNSSDVMGKFNFQRF